MIRVRRLIAIFKLVGLAELIMRGASLVSLVGVAAGLKLWPQPSSVTIGSVSDRVTFRIESGGGYANFAIKSVGQPSTLLTDAISRSYTTLRASGDFAVLGTLATLDVNVTSSDTTLRFGVDECYNLTLGLESKYDHHAKLTARTVYGALRGLETFLQLADNYGPNDANGLLSVPRSFSISDTPRFSWRGLMIDTGRHFYPVSAIEHIIDTMAMSKLNVMHWHATDDQSFAVESKLYPRLTSEGAFKDRRGRPRQYTQQNVTDLVAYAAARGVIVVPEFDMPAHAAAWGAGYPQFMVQGACCSPAPFMHGDTLNPTIDGTYDFLDALLSELGALFATSPFLHLGGDEVPVTSWTLNTTVAAWMKAHGLDVGSTQALFVNRVKDGPKLTALQKDLVYWEEIFENVGAKALPKGTLIQAWKSNAMPAVVAAGHRTTNSFKWYLNHGCNNFGDGMWGDFYENDPLHFVPNASAAEQALVVGGETTMWAECVDHVIFDSIVWPRAAAAAEKLWSPRAATQNATTEVGERLAEHRCRLVARGVRAAPINDGGDDPRGLNAGCM